MLAPATPTTLCVGLDLAKQDFAYCLLLWDRTEPMKRAKLPHTPDGVARLVAHIIAGASAHGCTTVRLGMEATGIYWQPLMESLQAAPALQPYAPQAFLLNPRELAAYKQSVPRRPKTDLQDAYAIADYVRDGKAQQAFAREERYAALQVLTRHRLHLVDVLVAEKNRLLTTMFRKFSRLSQAPPFAHADAATALALLTEFHTPEEVATLPLETLVAFLDTRSHGRLADVADVARTVQELAATSYRLPPALVEPINLSLTLSLQNLHFLQAQLRELDRPIRRALRALPGAASLQSIPGIGPVFAAGLVAEIQDITRFADHAALANYAGLVWHAHQSGPFAGEDLSLPAAAHTILRTYFVEAANAVRVHTAEYAAYYQRKYAESPKHKHKRALVLTARKLVRLVHHLLLTETTYLPPSGRKEGTRLLVH